MTQYLREARWLRLSILALALLAPIALAGCNAVDGLGKDLQESSENVKEAASD